MNYNIFIGINRILNHYTTLTQGGIDMATNSTNTALNVIPFPASRVKPSEAKLLTPQSTPAPVKHIYSTVTFESHVAQPIKSLDDIIRVSDHFITQGNYRNNLLFIMGINAGLRISDLLAMRFLDVLNSDCSIKNEITICEIKTRNTKKQRVLRHITINDSMKEAIKLYVDHTEVEMDDFLFKSQSNNSKNKNKPMSRQGVQFVLGQTIKDLDLNIRSGTHLLRKTFGYQFMEKYNGDHRAIHLLQNIFNHSHSSVTLRYIGITSEEISDAYAGLNLGMRAAEEN